MINRIGQSKKCLASNCANIFFPVKNNQLYCCRQCKIKARIIRWNNSTAATEVKKRWKRNHLEYITMDRRKSHIKRRSRKKKAEGTHTPLQFMLLCYKYKWRCKYCNCKLTKDTVTEDHIIALSRGGTDSIENIVPACRSCNSRKGNRIWLI